MNIFILHRIPYHKIDYHRGIDHVRHTVTYFGTAGALAGIPAELPCIKIERPGKAGAAKEAFSLLGDTGGSYARVISLSEYELFDAALIRERYGIIGPQPHEVELVRDKVIMKQAVAQAGLRVPRFLPLSAFVMPKNSGLQYNEDTWNGACVLKPVDGASSEDVMIYESVAQAQAALRERRTGIPRLDRPEPSYTDFEIEEFVDGPILHIDGLVIRGKVVVCIHSRYVGTCAAYAQGEALGSVQLPPCPKIQAWTAQVLQAVKITQGSFHLEAIESPRGLVFLEIANRIGGAEVVSTFEYATGIHLPSAELASLVEESWSIPAMPERAAAKFYGWFVLPGHHFRHEHARVVGFTPFRESYHMVRSHQLAEEMRLPRHVTYQAHEVPAAGIVQGETSQDIVHFLEILFQTVTVVPLELALVGSMSLEQDS